MALAASRHASSLGFVDLVSAERSITGIFSIGIGTAIGPKKQKQANGEVGKVGDKRFSVRFEGTEALIGSKLLEIKKN